MVSFTLINIDEKFWNKFTNTFPRQVSLQNAFKYVMLDWVNRVDSGKTSVLGNEESLKEKIKEVIENE